MKHEEEDEIRRLLGKARQGEYADDFEREAAEGFMAMGTIRDAELSKESLDRRIAPLFGKTKKSLMIYWGMAAGLLVMIGFSIFFLRGSGTLETRRQLSESSHSVKDAIISQAPATAKEMTEPTLERTETKATPVVSPEKQVTRQAPELATGAGKAPEQPEQAPAGSADQMMVSADADSKSDDIKENEASVEMPESRDAATAYEPETSPVPKKRANFSRSSAPPANETPQVTAAAANNAAGAPAPGEAGGCLMANLRKKLPPELRKEFRAKATVMNGKVSKVEFDRRSGLGKQEEKKIDSLLLSTDPGCPGIPPGEGEILLHYEP